MGKFQQSGGRYPVIPSEKQSFKRGNPFLPFLTKMINSATERIAAAVCALPRNDIQGEFCVDCFDGIGECRPTGHYRKIAIFFAGD